MVLHEYKLYANILLIKYLGQIVAFYPVSWNMEADGSYKYYYRCIITSSFIFTGITLQFKDEYEFMFENLHFETCIQYVSKNEFFSER